MQPLGQIAGIGASFISALSSCVAALFAMSVGRFHDGTLVPVTTGMLVALILASTLFTLA
ncbi:MAG: hypothetical protein R3C97_17010 [Geminicoccaceae bacterium]